MIKLQIDKPYKKNCTTSLMMLVQAYTYRRNRLEPCGRNAEGNRRVLDLTMEEDIRPYGFCVREY